MRPMTFRVLSIFILFIFLTSCKKDKEVKRITVTGKVLNESTNQPVQGITVSLNESCGGGSIGSGGGWSTISSTTTDNNGLYTFNQEVSDCSGWTVNINASTNYNSKYSTNWFDVTPNQNLNKTTFIYRNATLTVSATTTNPLGPNDDFFMDLPGIGCRCFQESTGQAKGGFYNTITWTVIRNNISNNFSASVYCPVDTIKYYTINY